MSICVSPAESSHINSDPGSDPGASLRFMAQKRLAPLPCGLVLFDHLEDVSDGTAYLPDTPTQRIRSPNDLRNDVLWVSNASVFEEKAQNYPNLRSGYYFRILLSEMAHDLGIAAPRDAQMGPDDASRMAIIMTRAMTIAARAYGWDIDELGPLRVQESFLMKDIAKMLPAAPTPDSRVRDDLVRALTQAYQEVSEPNWASPTYEPDSVYVTLRFNRVNYVNQLLSQSVPRGREWVRIDGAPAGGKAIDYCFEHPCLVKATVEWDNASSDMAALAAFGHSGKRRASMRLWLSQPELLWMSQFAKITISTIWVDKSGFGSLPVGARLPPLFTAHPEACLSYSAGLVAHNHWQALAMCTWNRRLRIEESTVWATWLRALDRAMMFSMAVEAYKAGFHVDRYGGGGLRIRVKRSRLDELAQFKNEHGFMYPDIASLLEREGI